MAAGAAQTLVHVHGMVEVHVVRQVMHADPGNRLPGGPALPHRLQQLGIGPDLRVAVDACLGRRYAGVEAFFHRGVAVLALQPQPFHVVRVAERHGLVRPLSLPRYPRRALQLIQCHTRDDHDQTRQNKACPDQRVRTSVKYLRHECSLPPFPALYTVRGALVQRCYPATPGRTWCTNQHIGEENVAWLEAGQS